MSFNNLRSGGRKLRGSFGLRAGKAIKPNLTVTRRTVAADTKCVPKKSEISKNKRHPSPTLRDRGRGSFRGGRGHATIQSHSIFEQGPTAEEKFKVDSSYHTSAYRSAGTSSVSIKTESSDVKQPFDSKKLFNDQFVSHRHLESSVWMLPTILPLEKRCHDLSEKIKSKKEEEDENEDIQNSVRNVVSMNYFTPKIKKESDDSNESEIQTVDDLKSSKTVVNKLHGSGIVAKCPSPPLGDLSVSDLFMQKLEPGASNTSELLFIQLPDDIPIFHSATPLKFDGSSLGNTKKTIDGDNSTLSTINATSITLGDTTTDTTQSSFIQNPIKQEPLQSHADSTECSDIKMNPSDSSTNNSQHRFSRKIGRLRLYKSGRAKLILMQKNDKNGSVHNQKNNTNVDDDIMDNNVQQVFSHNDNDDNVVNRVTLDLSMGTPCSFLQDIIHVRIPRASEDNSTNSSAPSVVPATDISNDKNNKNNDNHHGQMTVLGHSRYRLLCVPDIASVLDSDDGSTSKSSEMSSTLASPTDDHHPSFRFHPLSISPMMEMTSSRNRRIPPLSDGPATNATFFSSDDNSMTPDSETDDMSHYIDDGFGSDSMEKSSILMASSSRTEFSALTSPVRHRRRHRTISASSCSFSGSSKNTITAPTAEHSSKNNEKSSTTMSNDGEEQYSDMAKHLTFASSDMVCE